MLPIGVRRRPHRLPRPDPMNLFRWSRRCRRCGSAWHHARRRGVPPDQLSVLEARTIDGSAGFDRIGWEAFTPTVLEDELAVFDADPRERRGVRGAIQESP